MGYVIEKIVYHSVAGHGQTQDPPGRHSAAKEQSTAKYAKGAKEGQKIGPQGAQRDVATTKTFET